MIIDPVSSKHTQMSLFGPLMFFISINDLPEVIEGYCNLYEDESNIFRVIEDESIADSLQGDIYTR